MNNDLCDRLFNFAVDVIEYLKSIKKEIEENIIRYQLTKAATSSGANYEESQGASSRADFYNKIRISLKEMREANYWLRIFSRIENIKKEENKRLVEESEELKKILGAIASKLGLEKDHQE